MSPVYPLFCCQWLVAMTEQAGEQGVAIVAWRQMARPFATRF